MDIWYDFSRNNVQIIIKITQKLKGLPFIAFRIQKNFAFGNFIEKKQYDSDLNKLTVLL